MRAEMQRALTATILILLLAGVALAQTGKPSVVPKASKTQNSQAQAKAPDIHIHMPSGKKKITFPDGRTATSEEAPAQ